MEDSDKTRKHLTNQDYPIIQFKDSGWILFYKICGGICCFVGVLVLFYAFAYRVNQLDNISKVAAFIFSCSALLAGLFCFFASHVLRLQEKTAHHAERTADAIERLLDKK